MPEIEVALFEPEIPQNTGNIGRLCVGFDTKLSLIGRLGFSLDDKHFRRAGLDYWQHLQWKFYEDFETFAVDKKELAFFLLSKRGERTIYQTEVSRSCCLIFGKETTGFPTSLQKKHAIPAISIPMLGPIRSYNLANAVAMSLAEMNRKIKRFY